MKRAFFLLVLWLGGTLMAPAAGLIIIHESDFWSRRVVPHHHPHPPHPPHPPIIRPPRPIPPPPPRTWAPLEVAFLKADVKIKDQIAFTHIEEEFYNPNSSRLEGTFLFPVPKGASIDRFTMEINGKQMEAELLKADKARGIYEEIVRKLKDPALLEYAGQDLFKVRIFPIEPRSKKRITLDYSQLLNSDNGLVNFVFPFNTKKYSAKPLKTVSLKVSLETKRPLKSIYSPSHSVEVKRHGDDKATVGFEANHMIPDTDLQLWFAEEEGAFGLNLLTHKSADQDGFFVLLASPGAETISTKVIPKDVVFVLDTSGSMAGPKLVQAKKALNFCVENLNENDRFEILKFATEVEPLFDSLTGATESHREKAHAFIKKLKPIGGTAIDQALEKALSMRSKDSDRPYMVIFLTDGRPTIGTTDENQIVSRVIKGKESLTRIFCFGIGTDVNTHLLDRITEQTKSYSQYVLPEEDIEIKVSNFFTKIKEPVLANPKLVFPDGLRVTKMYPNPLPDLFKGEQLVVVGRYELSDSKKSPLAGRVHIKGSMASEEKSFGYDAAFPIESEDHEFIPRLWATRRVGYLLDEIRLRGENKELKEEVITLARHYGIVTPYTAYLIVEDEKQLGLTSNQQLFRNEIYSDRFERDLSSAYYSLSGKRSGETAVGGAESLRRLKSVDSAAPLAVQDANESAILGTRLAITQPASPSLHKFQSESRQRGQASGAIANLKRPANDTWSEEERFVGGRTFYKKDNGWIDGSLRGNATIKPIRIQFDSEEYYELIKKHPETLRWLALGKSLQFELNKQIYEIFE